MNIIDLFLIAVGLSADAFAVAVSVGLTMSVSKMKKAVIVGLYFGAFQAGMPLLGFLLASHFAGQMLVFGDMIAFALLSILGIKMIIGGFKGESESDSQEEASVSPLKMVPLALATSIDAFAVGVSFAFIQVDIVPAVSLIGLTTFVLSAAGVKIGSAFGAKLQNKANIAGGAILVLMGLRILLF